MTALVAVPALTAANKSAKQAEKLAGNFAKIEEARSKVKEALEDSAEAGKAYTLYVAGKVEEGAFRHYSKLLGINRNDPSVDRTKMADALLSALDYYERSMRADTTINKKGKVETRYSERMAEWLNAVTPSLYNAGVAYMNKRMFYPQAYTAFRAFAEAPAKYYYHPGEQPMTDSVQATAWFYAGVMAYNAQQFRKAAEAFELARTMKYPKKEVLLNEMSCLSQIAKEDSTLTDSLSRRITLLAASGHERFGLGTPIFIKKYVAGLLYEQRPDSALRVVDRSLEGASDSGLLHSMRAALLNINGDTRGAIAEYRIAAAHPDADVETLKEGAKVIAKEGITRLDSITGNRKAAREERAAVKEEYLRPALEYAKRARELAPDDTDIANTIDAIEYNLH